MFGYDPVEDQYKVLAVDDCPWRSEHKVVVLGGEEAWREAPCVACPHVARTLYYGAFCLEDTDSMHSSFIIVSFAVRLETFNIIKVPSYMLVHTDKTSLINYRGKIGVVENPCKGSFRMWVVEDAEKEEWSMNTFHFPQSFAGLVFNVMDTFYTGEICLVPKELLDPFCLFYYNLEKKSMRSVIIEGLPVSKLKLVRDIRVTVSDHHESFMFLET